MAATTHCLETHRPAMLRRLLRFRYPHRLTVGNVMLLLAVAMVGCASTSNGSEPEPSAVRPSAAEDAEGMERSARRLIAAAKAATDAKTRNARLDEAVALLKKAIALRKADEVKAVGEVPRVTATVKRWQTELQMIVADALTRGKPYADRLLYLQARQGDHIALARATARGATAIRRLLTEMEETVPLWRGELRTWIVVCREAGGLAVETRYRAAQILLHHGMAIRGDKNANVPPAAMNDLQRARTLGEELANAPRDAYRVRSAARLLVARACRELGEHDAAAKMLTTLLADNPSADMTIDAHFETVRNLIEQGQTLARQNKNAAATFACVPAAIKTFRTKATAAVKKDPAKRRVDLLAALAENALYETCAAIERANWPGTAVLKKLPPG